MQSEESSSFVVRRKIPVWVRWCLYGFAVILFLALTAWVITYGLARSAEARWDRLAAGIHAKGEPLTFDEVLSARPIIPEDQNGTIVIQHVLEMLPVETEVGQSGVMVLDSECWNDAHDGLEERCLLSTRAYLANRQAAIEELDQLRRYALTRFDFDYRKPIIPGGLLDLLSRFRYLAKLIHVNGLMNTLDGRAEEVINAIELQLHLSASLREEPLLITHLVAAACDGLNISLVKDFLAHGGLTSAELARLQAIWDRYDRQHVISARTTLLGERAMLVNMTDSDFLEAEIRAAQQVLALQQGAGPSQVTPSLFRRAWDAMPHHKWYLSENRAQAVSRLTRLVDASHDLPTLLSVARNEYSMLPPSGWGSEIARMNLPSMARSIELHARLAAQTRSLIVALAAERFRLDYDRFPQSLDELTPDYLSEIPIDPFNGVPLCMVLNDDGFTVYSVGENYVDDGGKIDRDKENYELPDVGFRLLHPDKRTNPLIVKSDE